MAVMLILGLKAKVCGLGLVVVRPWPRAKDLDLGLGSVTLALALWLSRCTHIRWEFPTQFLWFSLTLVYHKYVKLQEK